MKMTERQLIERLLELQEHPELVSDEQLLQALDDPQMRNLVEQVTFAKRAFKNEALQEQECDIEEEWCKFTNKHFEEEGNAKQKNDSIGQRLKSIFHLSSLIFNQPKAASFIGLLVVSGIAFAAIHFVRLSSHTGELSKSPAQETRISNPHQQMAPTDAVKTDTAITTAQDSILGPVVFDNVRLDEMLPQMAAYYHTEVVFQNDAARELRFHFIWKHEDGLEHAIEKLNRFESLTVRLEKNKIIIE